jgi:hypothetical protein
MMKTIWRSSPGASSMSWVSEPTLLPRGDGALRAARLDDDRVGQVAAAADEVLAVAGVAGRGLAAAEEVVERRELGPDPDDAVLAAAEDDVLGPVQVVRSLKASAKLNSA